MVIKDIKDNKINLSLNSDENITIFVENDLDIEYYLKNGKYKILVFNNSSKDICLKEKGEIKNSEVTINYIELNNFSLKHENSIEIYKNSSLEIKTIYLGCNKKDIKFNLIHKESVSISHITNNVVCLNDADFNMEVVGKIKKGAKASKCHQKSRCLTFEKPKKSRILPVLLIDENDVEASHSLSSGTIDEDVLFYMNSRGLSKKEALKLFLTSYLMPNEEFYKEYEDGLKINEIARKKVEKICMM